MAARQLIHSRGLEVASHVAGSCNRGLADTREELPLLIKVVDDSWNAFALPLPLRQAHRPDRAPNPSTGLTSVAFDTEGVTVLANNDSMQPGPLSCASLDSLVMPSLPRYRSRQQMQSQLAG
jgi:hypothetical protein